MSRIVFMMVSKTYFVMLLLFWVVRTKVTKLVIMVMSVLLSMNMVGRVVGYVGYW